MTGLPAPYNDVPAPADAGGGVRRSLGEGGWLSVAEAAAILGCTVRHARRMCRTRQLRARRDGAGRWEVDPLGHAAFRVARGLTAGPAAAPADGEISVARLSAPKRARLARRYEIVAAFEADAAVRLPGLALAEFARLWAAAYNVRHPADRPVSARTLHRWRRRFRDGGAAGLADRRDYHGPTAEVADDAWELFLGMFLNQSQPKIARLHEHVAAIAAVEGWAWPSVGTVRRWVARLKLDPKLAVAGRDPKRFRDRMTATIERDWSAIPAHGVWVGDHRELDVLWPRFEMPSEDRPGRWRWRRPWLTAFLDARTWMPVGSSLAFEAPNGNRVMATFARAIGDHGIPGNAYLDNGKDFRMRRFAGGRWRRPDKNETICPEHVLRPMLDTLGVAATFALPYNARAKVIEPWFRLMAEWFDKSWPTYCGPSTDAKPEQIKALLKRGRAEAFAAARLDEADFRHAAYDRTASQVARDRLCLAPLQRAFDAWVAEDYGLRVSPSRWCGGLSSARALLELADPDRSAARPPAEDLALLLTPSKAVCVRARGIHVAAFHCHYWSDALEGRRGASGRDERRKVVYRFDPDDPSQIWVFDASGRFLTIATPSPFEGHHPLARDSGDPADSERLADAMAGQRRLAKRTTGQLGDLKRFAGNVLLAGQRGAADAMGKLDDPAALPAAPRGNVKLAGETSRAAAAGAAARRRRAERAVHHQTAAEFFATGTDPAPAEASAKAGPSVFDVLDGSHDEATGRPGGHDDVHPEPPDTA